MSIYKSSVLEAGKILREHGNAIPHDHIEKMRDDALEADSLRAQIERLKSAAKQMREQG